MKKIIIFGVICFLTIAGVMIINPSIHISNGDVTLKSVMVMAEAQAKIAPTDPPDNCYSNCKYTGGATAVRRCGDGCLIVYQKFSGTGECQE